jgi:hypothetical protein
LKVAGRAILQQDQTTSPHILTRHDKLAANYLAFIKLASFGFGYVLMSPRP